jgi:hypothetical protein
VGEHLVAAIGSDRNDRSGAGGAGRGRQRVAPGFGGVVVEVRVPRALTSAAKGAAASPISTASTGAESRPSATVRAKVTAW